MARKPKPVGSEELKDAILHLMVTRFGDRPLDWETVERACDLVNFEVKQCAVASTRLAVFAPRREP